MKYLLIAGLVIFNSGCSVPAKQAALHDFGLFVSTATHPDEPSVTVNAPTWLWDNRIRYRLLFSAPSQVRFYGLDRWVASPPELFEQLLATSGRIQNYALTIQLHEFEQQFDTQDRARVVLRFSVEAYSPNTKQKLSQQNFYLNQPTKTPDAAGAISSFNNLAQQAAGKIQDWLIDLNKTRTDLK